MIKTNSRLTFNSVSVFKELIQFAENNGAQIDLEKLVVFQNLEPFYSGIINNQWKSDEEACTSLFGSINSVKYNKLKSILRRLLITAICSNNNPAESNNSSIDLAYIRVNQEFVVYNLLHSQNHITSAAYIGELIISSSINFSFSEFILKVSSELIEYFSIFDINRSKTEYYRKVQREYLITIEWEQKAYYFYSQMMNLFVKEFSPGEQAVDIANKFIPSAKKHLHKINSVKFHLRYYLIEIFKHYSLKNYEMMDTTAESAVTYFRSLKYRRIRSENMFLKKRIEANLVLGNFQLCENLLSEILSSSFTGNTNWFNSLEIKTTLQLHQKKYTESIESFLTGKKNISFESIPKTTAQRWGLLEAYINFLQRVGVAPESPTMSRFRINRFINDTPQYEEDKKGRNIQLIIAQLLFYILDKNWDKMEEKIDALQKYGTRYLRKNELFRSQVFIKMLLEIPRRMYHPKAIIRHTAKYRKRLEEMAPNIDLNGSTLEIIPYEHLWELIIQNIVPPKYQRKTKVKEVQPA